MNTKMLNNSILLNDFSFGEDKQGKGRYFTSKFIEPGLAKYEEPIGVLLLTKETLDKFASSFKGCPVIVEHADVTDENAKDLRVGGISNVWYNDADGWYYCDGVIFDKKAQDLIINNEYTVSCAYSYETDKTSGTLHNIFYDSKVIFLDFLHLAIVKTPRYEGANIILNGGSGSGDNEEVRNELFSLFNKKIKNYNKENNDKNKEQLLMTVLNDLEKFVKDVVQNACGLKTDDTKKGENEVNKQELIEEVSKILQGKIDEGIIKNIIDKIENEDNGEEEKEEKKEKIENEDDVKEGKEEKKEEKIDNEDDEKEDKKENEDEDKNLKKLEKAENSLNYSHEISYISRSKRLELGNKY